MTYLPHWRVTFKGGFRAGNSGEGYEEWNTSLALKPGLIRDWGTDAQDVVQDLCNDFMTLLVDLEPLVSASTYFHEVRMDAIGPNGKTTQDAVFARPPIENWAGQGLPVLPPQCAVVLTLDTKVRGRSRFGRMYLPLLGCTVSSDGLMGVPLATRIATAGQKFINNAGNTPNVDLDFAPVVASGVGNGSLHEIRSVRVGRAIDTMRSRRRNLDEGYVTLDVSV